MRQLIAREIVGALGLVALVVGLAGYDWRLAAIVAGGLVVLTRLAGGLLAAINRD